MEINLRYEEPIGRICLRVRANRGSDAFILGEVFEQQYYKFRLFSEPTTILDLGANAGFASIFFARTFPSALIAAVEPVSANVRMLQWNIQRNAPSVNVIRAAVAVQDGPLAMEINLMDYGHKVVEKAKPTLSKHLLVEGVSIPSILARLGWERIGLLKVDIEGYERELLTQNCEWLRCVDALCVECHEGFGEKELNQVAEKFHFRSVKEQFGIWWLSRN